MTVARNIPVPLTLAGIGTGLAILLATPLLLAIPVGIGGVYLTRRYQFLRDVQQVRQQLTVEQSVETRHVRKGTPTPLTSTATTTSKSLPPVDISIEIQLPLALSTDDTRTYPVTLRRQRHSLLIEGAVAGRYTIPAPRVTVSSRDGRFETTFEHGPTETLVVTPAGPRSIHVGEGGDRIAAAYGEHPAGTGGAGLDPSELRKYLPGDPTNRIDWKATARLNEPHVREFDAETDRETQLIVDTRAPLAMGPPGETKLDYARELALAIVTSAEQLRDPLGLITIADTASTILDPDTGSQHYHALRTRLHDLTPTTRSDTDGVERWGPDTAHRYATRLTGNSTPFATTLRGFFERRERYLEALDERPLFSTLRARHAKRSGRVWTVLITDDTNRVETRETVKLARQRGNVLVCLLPSLLYEQGGLADLDDAYARYLDFEAFRRQLATTTGVRALEVGPQDRLHALLTTQQSTPQDPTP